MKKESTTSLRAKTFSFAYLLVQGSCRFLMSVKFTVYVDKPVASLIDIYHIRGVALKSPRKSMYMYDARTSLGVCGEVWSGDETI